MQFCTSQNQLLLDKKDFIVNINTKFNYDLIFKPQLIGTFTTKLTLNNSSTFEKYIQSATEFEKKDKEKEN